MCAWSVQNINLQQNLYIRLHFYTIIFYLYSLRLLEIILQKLYLTVEKSPTMGTSKTTKDAV